jgi:osmotically-inducible protein OsmY
MKTPKLFALLLAAAPAVMFAASTTDVKIEDAAKASYNYRTVLQGRVKIAVDDGVVTLTGQVDDADLRILAEDTVRDLPGVLRVDDQIMVVPAAPEHSDGWIAIKARGRLLTKANVSATATSITVKDGVVTLAGRADSLAQKELTEAYVKEIDGVKDVRNDLVVSVPPAEPSRTMGEVVDDASITAEVKYALLTHRATSALKTKVTTKEGAVAIDGEAGSAAEKDLVTQLAQSVHGVKNVVNDMTVKE